MDSDFWLDFILLFNCWFIDKTLFLYIYKAQFKEGPIGFHTQLEWKLCDNLPVQPFKLQNKSSRRMILTD